MFGGIAPIWARVVGWFRKPVVKAAAPIVEVQAEPTFGLATTAGVAVPADKHPPQVRFTHISELLDELDKYWEWLRKLRAVHPQFYVLAARLGAVVTPDGGYVYDTPDALIKKGMLPKNVEEWPAFLMMTWPCEDTEKTIHAKMVIFNKVKRGTFIPRGVTYYEGLMLWSRRGKALNFGDQFYIGISKDGRVMPLKFPCTRKQRLPNNGGTITHSVVDYPTCLKEVARDNSKRRACTVEELVAGMFAIAASVGASADQGFQIHARRGVQTARFNIAGGDAKVIFRDRAITLTSGGKRSKIFHEVEAHERRLSDGRVVQVSAHYRGLRRFSWNGNEITITVPGHHHTSLLSFTGAALDGDAPPEERKGTMPLGAGAKIVEEAVQRSEAIVRKGETVRSTPPDVMERLRRAKEDA